MSRFFSVCIGLVLLLTHPASMGQAPRIDSIDPSQGPIAGGTSVTINGAHFSGATFTVDRTAVTPQLATDTQIRFTTASHDNGFAAIALTNSAGAAHAEFLYVPPRLQDLPPGYITTVAGVGLYSGFYRPAVQAEVQPQSAPAFDRAGNMYLPEPGNDRVTRVRTDGIFEPFAGNGIPGSRHQSDNGDGGPAVDAYLWFPRSATVQDNGDVYITSYDCRIRRVDGRTGIITTVAGNGTRGFSGDGGPAVNAVLHGTTHICSDGKGTITFIDYDDTTNIARIRRITPDGIIRTIAGVGPPGYSGDGGPATQAQFNFGFADMGALALDPQGNLFIADINNNCVRRIDAATGIITTFATSDDLRGVACDAQGNVYYNHAFRIVKLNPAGQTLTTYGNGRFPGVSDDGVLATDAYIHPYAVAVDPSGNIVYVDGDVRRVRRINIATGRIETLAGSASPCVGENGPAIATTLSSGCGDVAFLPSGDLLVTDAGHNLLRKIDANGQISTVGSSNSFGWNGYSAVGIETDAFGQIYLATAWTVGRVDPTGGTHAVAGTYGVYGFTGDGGPATAALLGQPWDVCVDSAGNIFIADTNNNRVRRVDVGTGIITTVAGSGPINGYEHYDYDGNGSYTGDGGPATAATLNTPYGVAVDASGNLFIADGSGNGIRKVDTNGIITTFSRENTGTKLTFDRNGVLYSLGSTVGRYDQNGRATELSGGGAGFFGDGGPALNARALTGGQTDGLAIDAEGNVFFVDSGNRRVRAIRYGALLAAPTIVSAPAAVRVASGASATIAVVANGFPTLSYQWKKDGTDLLGATNASYTISAATAADAATYSVAITNLMGSVTSAGAALTVGNGSNAPTVAAPPIGQTVVEGDGATLNVIANGSGAVTYQWRKNGAPIAGATNATLALGSVQLRDAGNYDVIVANAVGTVTSDPAKLAVNYARLANVSTRGLIPEGGSLTAGLFLRGTGAKPVLIRAVGPTLAAFGLGNAVGSCRLEIIPQGTSTPILANEQWDGSAALRSLFNQVGAFPLQIGSKDSAISTALPNTTGYSVRIAANGTATTGIALAEIYAADADDSPVRFNNLSTLGYTGTGANVLSVGFAVRGTVAKKLLIRAIGPGLAAFHVPDALADPQLVVIPAGQVLSVASNDDWAGAAILKAAFDQSGAFGLNANSRDAALVVSLPPGTYSAVITGAGGTTGNVLAELYDLDP